MPSTNTITSLDLTSFVAGTRIKSVPMNTNFSIWRGHILPVDASISAAADNNYDLGSSDYRWRKVYCLNIGGLSVVSTTGSSTISLNNAVTLMDTTAATLTATLPTAVGNDGAQITIKNIGTGSKTAYLDGNGAETIDNTLTVNLIDSESTTLVAKSSKWWSI